MSSIPLGGGYITRYSIGTYLNIFLCVCLLQTYFLLLLLLTKILLLGHSQWATFLMMETVGVPVVASPVVEWGVAITIHSFSLPL